MNDLNNDLTLARRPGASGIGDGVRIAIVHDWLYTLGGAERVLASMLRCFPQADMFCLFDVLSSEDRAKIGFSRSTTSFLQRAPFIRRRHRMYLPIMPLAVEQLDVGGYDIVISSSYAVAKGVLTGPDQLHLAYVHSPMRYAWDLQHQYLRESGLSHGLKSMFARLLLHYMRLWDVRTAHGPDDLMSNSHFVARRLRKIYGRQAEVIPPPVAVPAACPDGAKQDFFLTASRLVPYKNIHLIVETFRDLPQERLVVAGEGPELPRLRALAGPNVEFVGYRPDHELRTLMASAPRLPVRGRGGFRYRSAGGAGRRHAGDRPGSRRRSRDDRGDGLLAHRRVLRSSPCGKRAGGDRAVSQHRGRYLPRGVPP